MKKLYNKALLLIVFGLLSFNINIAYAEEQAKIINNPIELVQEASKVKIDFKEGTHYKVIEGAQLSEHREVREFFSFFCGHCYHFYPFVSVMALALPEEANFVGNPVHYLGGPMGMMTMKAYAVSVNLQITDHFVKALNRKIFEQNKIPQGEDDLALVFEEIGVPKQKFLAQFRSFPVSNMANQYKQKTEDSKIQGVPAVVINNKYQIITGSVKGEAEYFALVQYLLNLDKNHYIKQEK